MTIRNRGKESSDDKWFGPKWHPVFTEAVNDFCFLLTRGYTENLVFEMVGNRYRLNKRQRNAILRVSSAEQEIMARQHSMCQVHELKNETVEIDGFNLLILLECAMSGAFIFKGRDGTYRDISSVHGSYKRVQKTGDAILLTGNILNELGVKSVKWYLDQPVSNSGRLKTRLLEISRANHFNWEVELAFNPDKILAESKNIVVTSDGWILDRVQRWFNLGAFLVENYLKDANVIIV